MKITQKTIIKRRQSIIHMFCECEPPYEMCEDDDNNSELQSWIGAHQNECIYSTNLSIMDAAWDIASSQIENGIETIKE